MNLQNRSKIAGCSHERIFLAIEIAVKIAVKIAVNIARVKGPLRFVASDGKCNSELTYYGIRAFKSPYFVVPMYVLNRKRVL